MRRFSISCICVLSKCAPRLYSVRDRVLCMTQGNNGCLRGLLGPWIHENKNIRRTEVTGYRMHPMTFECIKLKCILCYMFYIVLSYYLYFLCNYMIIDDNRIDEIAKNTRSSQGHSLICRYSNLYSNRPNFNRTAQWWATNPSNANVQNPLWSDRTLAKPGIIPNSKCLWRMTWAYSLGMNRPQMTPTKNGFSIAFRHQGAPLPWKSQLRMMQARSWGYWEQWWVQPRCQAPELQAIERC